MESWRSFRLVAAAALAMSLGFIALPVAAEDDINPEQISHQAAVEVDGAMLFRVRGTTSFPAEGRAAGIAQRIETAALDRSVDPASVRTGTSNGLTAIFAGPTRIMVVSEADAQLEQLTVPALAQANEARIRAAIVDYRAARTPERMTRAALMAGGSTVLYFAVAALLFWITGRLRHRVESSLHARIHTVGIQSFAIVRAERARAMVSALLRLLRILALLVITFVWLVYALRQFPWTLGLANALLDHVIAPLSTLGRGLVHAIPNLIFLVVLYFLVRFGLRVVRMFFEAVDRGLVTLENFEREWAMPTYKLVRLAIVILALVVAYPYIPGSESAAFKGISLFLGVVFSLGSSTAVSNIIAGYMMTYRRAFRVGDRVKIGDIVGDVTAMRLQVTHVRTTKNEEVVIPNSQIVNGHVINYSTLARKEGLVLHTTVGIGYETPWRQVEAMLLEAARRTQGLAAEPQPYVLQTLLGDFAVSYELNVGCDDPHTMPRLYTALHRNILDVFNEHDVAIMTPAYVADPPEPKIVPKSEWFLPPAAPEKGSS
jgi:small-conductance mechanosensitive channel